MARRLLGPQNAAAVFQAQNSDAQDSPQVNKNNCYVTVAFVFLFDTGSSALNVAQLSVLFWLVRSLT